MIRRALSVPLGLLAVAAALVACQPPPTTSHGGGEAQGVKDHVTLVDHLRVAGAKVEPAGEAIQPFFSVKGTVLKVDGADVQVFEYDAPGAAEAEARKVSPDGSEVGTSHVGWVAPPHFFRKGRIVVVYIGDDPNLLRLLQGALGPQFAGK
jgi:hypothetical protein